MTRPRLLVAVTLIAIGVAACNGSGRDSAQNASSDSTASTAVQSSDTATSGGSSSSGYSSSASSSSPATSSSSSDGDDGFPYPPWGPDDPPIPGQYAALAAAPGQPPRCAAVADAQPGGDFWATAVAVCRAITAAGPWPAKTTVPRPPTTNNAYETCLDAELSTMLKRALSWHAAHPGRKPKVRFPSRTTTSPCQLRIYDVRVLGAGDLVQGEKQPEGLALAITAAGANGDVNVRVDGQPVEFTSAFDVAAPGDGLETIVVIAAGSDQPRKATIELPSDRGRLVTTVELPATTPGPSTQTPASTVGSSPSAVETSS
jgi:hypothetical protein